jgi:hypothetical protein
MLRTGTTTTLSGSSKEFGVAKHMRLDQVKTSRLTVRELEEIAPERAIRRAERDVLLLLHVATGGTAWRSCTNWRIDAEDALVTGLGRWFGVTTSHLENEQVTGLELSNNRLEGILPLEITQLSKLRTLDLSRNQVWGVLPPDINGCRLLASLDLSSNALSGEADNKASGARVMTLTAFALHCPPGPLPDALYDLRFLKKLDLSGNQLTGPISPAISRLRSLKELYLDCNALAGALPNELLAMLPRMISYRLSGNAFTLAEITPEQRPLFQHCRQVILADCGIR